eukprot:scaffold102147_cov29-Tisochrysis_lutea.AAC.7
MGRCRYSCGVATCCEQCVRSLLEALQGRFICATCCKCVEEQLDLPAYKCAHVVRIEVDGPGGRNSGLENKLCAVADATHSPIRRRSIQPKQCHQPAVNPKR